MKRLFLFIPLLWIACTHKETPFDSITAERSYDNRILTRSLVSSDSYERKDSNDAFITFSEVARLVNNPQASIEAFIGEDGDTLMYIVNYPNGAGWKLLSADKRTPAILAEGGAGLFSLNIPETGIASWIEGTARNMSIIRKSEDKALSFSEKEIRLNRSFWSHEPEISIDSTQMSKPRSPGEPGGHWEISTTSEVEPYDSVRSMVGHWCQGSPYNVFSPLTSDGSGTRAPAGCVAIAGAQVLSYLYDAFGLPSVFPDSCYVVGDVDNYVRLFYGASTNFLSSVSSEYHESSSYYGAECMLIAYVGHLVNMHYCNEYSWAFPSNLKTNVFEYYGYNCQIGEYDESIVKSSVLSGLPVIMIATNLLIPIDFDIHAFVIDGYLRSRIKYTHYHYWVPDVNLPGNGPDKPPFGGGVGFEPIDNYYTYSYSSPSITGIHINWGWRLQWVYPYYNDGWYTTTDDWLVYDGQNNYTYNYNRQMIYGFAVND